ncbi:nucleotide sugar dehydrogenase [Natrarchaeobius chitinivorans]|uniref:UDP-N-acetyl-D-mannosamine dehydrogenase n=1 Tax=Natrarchaeobius chitinivorans TaxID=1679083 RepID=A0A3N6M1F3_NATCH|nr:nucleotide sugar dehydrogenase [Natrarchaeobius chitinivorans]RQG97153.1 nucleotide sugar dehydrogenase [Natrarchaeobius chitinivorans]
MTDSLGLYGAERSERRQRELLTGGEIPVAVYGLGKMGLPLAGVYAETTGNVIGVDVDPVVVETVSSGRSHVVGEPGLDELVAEQVESGRLEATTDGPAAADRARIHVVIVPTLLTDDFEPDLSTIGAVADDVAAGLSPGDLVIAESTLPPGTCRDVLEPHLAAESDLEPDEFGLAFCPERTSSGTALRDIRGQYPKVVGGVDDESTRAAAVVYDELSANEVHPVSDATTAEAVKVFEGIYRDVNIALANELGLLADELGVSVREAIETANDLPMCQLHDPGPGVGGHCIPYYPHFVLAGVETPMDVVRTAREVNDGMPGAVAGRVEDELEATGRDRSDASVLVLGLTYRAGVEETRASPALDLVDELEEREIAVAGVDPLVDPGEYGVRAVDIEAIDEESFDAAVLVTAHEEFEGIQWDALEPTVVVDTRDTLDLEETHHRVYTLAGSRTGRRPNADLAAETGVAVGPEGPESTMNASGSADVRKTDGGNDV